jgi:hypothetical protein
LLDILLNGLKKGVFLKREVVSEFDDVSDLVVAAVQAKAARVAFDDPAALQRGSLFPEWYV